MFIVHIFMLLWAPFCVQIGQLFEAQRVFELCLKIDKTLSLKQNVVDLELRQFKNDSIWSKDKLTLFLPRFFTRLYGQWKGAAKLICLWTKWCRSNFVFALIKIKGWIALLNNETRRLNKTSAVDFARLGLGQNIQFLGPLILSRSASFYFGRFFSV